MDIIAVALEHDRILPAKHLLAKGRSELRLRTVDPYQPQAVIKIIRIHDKQRHVLKEIPLNGLKPQAEGYSRLTCRFRMDGKRIQLKILQEHRVLADTRFSSVPAAWRRRRWYWGIGIPLLTLLLTLLLLMLARSFTHSSKNLSNSQTQQDIEPSSQLESNVDSGVKELSEDTIETQKEPEESDIPESDVSEDISVQESSKEVSQTEYEMEQSEVVSNSSDSNLSTGTQNDVEQTILYPQGNLITLYFQPERGILTDQAEKELRDWLLSDNYYEKAQYIITGHCALYGTEEGRSALSRIRAETVKRWLLEHSFLSDSQMETIGMGIDDLITRDPDQQYLNRRVEIQIQP